MNSTQTSANQSIILQNTNEKEPIQLKVNPVTDYWALWFTILASVVVSTIAAYVTIKLVTDSNAKLIANQNLQNQKLLDNQGELQKRLIESQNQQLQREVKSKNRQEWINYVRELISETLTDSNSFTLISRKEHNIRVQRHKEANAKNERTTLPPPYPETVQLIRTFDKNVMLLDLLLSKDNEIDRNIHSKLENISKLHVKILAIYAKAKDKMPLDDDVNHEDFQRLKLVKETTSLTKELLKNEWIKVKDLK